MTLLLEWLATSTLTAAGGGDTLNTTYRRLYLDGAETETYSLSAEVTAHAVERVADVADHIRPGLRKVAMDVVFIGDPTNAREELESLIRTGQLMTITTGVGSYQDMVLTSLREPRSAATGDAYYCSIEAQEIRRVDSAEVEAPAPQVERARPATNRGGQSTQSTPTTQPTSATAADRPASLAARTTDGAAALLGGGS
jgi:hypothetical protein